MKRVELSRRAGGRTGGACVLFAALVLAGCGGGSSPIPPPNAKPEILYATGFNQIVGLQVSTTGVPGPATTTSGPDTALGTTQTIVTDPAGKFLLAAGQLSNCLAVYSIDQASGALGKLQEYPAGKNPNWIEVVTL